MVDLREMLDSELTSEKVERKGQEFYKCGKLFMLIGLCGFLLLVLMCLGGLMVNGVEGLLLVLAINPIDFEILKPIIFLCYVAISCGFTGVAGYYYGIQIFELGRIAVNTEGEGIAVTKKQGVGTVFAPKTVLQKDTLAADQKKCWACGTVQKASNRFCSNCNESI